MRRLALLTLLTFVAAVVASCGGGSSPIAVGASATSALTQPATQSTVVSGADSSVSTTSNTTARSATTATATGGSEDGEDGEDGDGGDGSSAVAEPCESPALPTGTSTAPVAVEVDGDQMLDNGYAVESAVGWTVVVELGAGGAVTYLVPDAGDEVWVVGSADLGPDERDELVVRTSASVDGDELSIMRVSGCEITRLSFEDSSPATFAVGSSFFGGDALACTPGQSIEVYRWVLVDAAGEVTDETNAEYEGAFIPYVIVGNVIKEGTGDGAVLSHDDIQAFDLLDCPGLEERS